MKKLLISLAGIAAVFLVANKLKANMERMTQERIAQLNKV
jgi:hypothetical protein